MIIRTGTGRGKRERERMDSEKGDQTLASVFSFAIANTMYSSCLHYKNTHTA